jgi:hypothetical protein
MAMLQNCLRLSLDIGYLTGALYSISNLTYHQLEWTGCVQDALQMNKRYRGLILKVKGKVAEACITVWDYAALLHNHGLVQSHTDFHIPQLQLTMDEDMGDLFDHTYITVLSTAFFFERFEICSQLEEKLPRLE